MFGMAGETQFDLRFNLFGIPIRVHPIFWLSAAVLWWDPDHPEIIVLATVCVFVSVLVHELGHALVFRHYGWPSEIVLYFLGGYATATRLSTWRQIWSLLAGPLAGLSFAAIVFGLRILILHSSPNLFVQFPALAEVFRILLFAGIIINLMNLIPCLPLDGGQIMAALVARYSSRGPEATIFTLQISIGAAAAVALWSAYCMNTSHPVIPAAFYWFLPQEHARYMYYLQPAPKFLMIFFGILAANSVIQYNNFKSYR